MSEPTSSHPDHLETPKPASPSSSRFFAAKLVLALLASAAAMAVVYRAATKPEDPFVDPVAAQAAIDKADTIVDRKEEVKDGFRVTYVKHKSGKVDMFSENLNPPTMPTTSASVGTSRGKGVPKKKAGEPTGKGDRPSRK